MFCPVAPLIALFTRCRVTLFSACLCLLFAAPHFAATATAATYPGFRSLGLWDEKEFLRLDLGVWYPVNRAPSSVRYGDWVLRVNRRAQPMEGRFPLVLLSHDSPANRFAYHHLAAELASQGFVVVAPTHQGDNLLNMTNLFTDRQLSGRLREVRQTIESVCANPDIGPNIDTNRIGLVGFGTGGTTALQAAGGRVSRQAWEIWKNTAPQTSPYLHRWIRRKLDSIVDNPELLRLQAIPGLRAVIAVSPAHSMFFDTDSLSRIRIPMLLIAAGQDPVNPAPDYLNILHKCLPQTPRLSFVPEATPLDFMAIPNSEQQSVIPGYTPPPPSQHSDINGQLLSDVTRFFLETIGDPNLAPPPPPLPDDTIEVAPELEPKPEPEPAPKAKKKKKR